MKVEGRFKGFIENFNRVVKGQEQSLVLMLSAFFSHGHVLLEGLPGTGKTTIALTMSRLLGLDFRRLQGTSDILPADITGAYIPDRAGKGFVFLKGPVFADILLVDEINRMNPRTQSALLEAMEEGQVTVEGNTHKLSEFFFVIATQNPLESHGTFPLPASELDRFMVRVEVELVGEDQEREIIRDGNARSRILELKPMFSRDELSAFMAYVKNIRVSEDIENYIFSLVRNIRIHPVFSGSFSTRALIHLYEMSRAHAFVMGREYVTPDDVKSVFNSVVLHRIALHLSYSEKKKILDEIKKSTETPL